VEVLEWAKEKGLTQKGEEEQDEEEGKEEGKEGVKEEEEEEDEEDEGEGEEDEDEDEEEEGEDEDEDEEEENDEEHEEEGKYEDFMGGFCPFSPQKISVTGLTWLWENNLSLPTVPLSFVCAVHGQPNVLRWLWGEEAGGILNGFSRRDCQHLAEIAAEQNHVEILKWIWNILPDLRITRTHQIEKVARNGSLEALKFLASKGC
jgi:hypothetical protein